MTRNPETIGFWEGRLPHWEVAEGRYFVTIHLAGAIPAQGHQRIRQLASENSTQQTTQPERWVKAQRRIFAEMEAWLDRAEFANHLVQPQMAEIVQEAIQFRQNRTWNMLEYVMGVTGRPLKRHCLA